MDSESNIGERKGRLNGTPITMQEPTEGTLAEAYAEHWPLSMDIPHAQFILREPEVHLPYKLVLPHKIRVLLPKAAVPVIVNYRNKDWSMRYFGNYWNSQRMDVGWKNFVLENELKMGDGCVFELSEYSATLIKFRVQILDGELPIELLRRGEGGSSETAISISE